MTLNCAHFYQTQEQINAARDAAMAAAFSALLERLGSNQSYILGLLRRLEDEMPGKFAGFLRESDLSRVLAVKSTPTPKSPEIELKAAAVPLDIPPGAPPEWTWRPTWEVNLFENVPVAVSFPSLADSSSMMSFSDSGVRIKNTWTGGESGGGRLACNISFKFSRKVADSDVTTLMIRLGEAGSEEPISGLDGTAIVRVNAEMEVTSPMVNVDYPILLAASDAAVSAAVNRGTTTGNPPTLSDDAKDALTIYISDVEAVFTLSP